MKEWSDEELDKLFRESSEKFDPTYEPGDWDALKQRLDAAEDVGQGGWLKKAAPWLAALLLILIGGIGVYLTVGGNKGEKVPLVAGTHPVDHSVTAQIESKAKKAGRVGTSTTQFAASSPTANALEQPIAAQSGRKGINEITNEKGPKELPRRLASVSGVRDQTDLPRQESGNGAIFSNKNEPDPPIRNEWPELNLVSHRAAYVAPAALIYPVVAYESPTDYVTAIPPSAPIDIPKWSIRIGISPDLSMIKGSDMMTSANLGPSGSLLVERSLGRRLSVQTGIIRSLKNYYAQGGEYNFPESWAAKQAKAPSSVDGRFNVFEIPLNIRLDLSQNIRSRWFGSAGVSSYKMQREKDTYHYDTYVPNAMPGWDGGTGWYLLSHANISVGYERFIARRLSLVAEPYARVPLRGVGMGKVNLVTMGVWFSVRYTPVFRK